MPKNKVNNNIKLKPGGGIINDATDGLSLESLSTKILTAGEDLTGATTPQPVFIGIGGTTAIKGPTPDTLGTDYIYGSSYRAQTFVATNLLSISKVTISIRTSSGGLSGNITLGIYATSAGLPTGAALATQTVAMSSLATNTDYMALEFTLISALDVTPGDTYAVVLSHAEGASANDAFVWRYLATGTYSGGSRITSSNSGSSWTATTGDYAFQIDGAYAFESGKVYLCDADNQARLCYIGFATTTASAGNDVVIKTGGILTGFTGLTIGSSYYVQDDKTIGTTVGTYEVQVGIAISETELLISLGKDEYVGTENASGSGTTKTFTMPAIARTAILNIAYAADRDSSYNPVFQIVLKRKGITSQTFRGVGNANYDMKLVASLSGDTITLTASTINAGTIGTCVAFYYN